MLSTNLTCPILIKSVVSFSWREMIRPTFTLNLNFKHRLKIKLLLSFSKYSNHMSSFGFRVENYRYTCMCDSVVHLGFTYSSLREGRFQNFVPYKTSNGQNNSRNVEGRKMFLNIWKRKKKSFETIEICSICILVATLVCQWFEHYRH